MTWIRPFQQKAFVCNCLACCSTSKLNISRQFFFFLFVLFLACRCCIQLFEGTCFLHESECERFYKELQAIVLNGSVIRWNYILISIVLFFVCAIVIKIQRKPHKTYGIWVRFVENIKIFRKGCIVCVCLCILLVENLCMWKYLYKNNILNNNPPGNYFSALICLCLWIIMLFFVCLFHMMQI